MAKKEKDPAVSAAVEPVVAEAAPAVVEAEAREQAQTEAIAKLTALTETLEKRLQDVEYSFASVTRENRNMREQLVWLEKKVPQAMPQDKYAALRVPMPAEAVTPHPSNPALSSVKPIYVFERLNEVFGLGGWNYTSEIVTTMEVEKTARGETYSATMVVAKVVLSVPQYGIVREAFGGNDNDDLGDAYKGAVTDALSKAASWIGVAIEVYKGEGPTKNNGGRRAVRSAVPTAPAVTPVTGEIPPCEDCKQTIKECESKGEKLSPGAIVAFSRKKWLKDPARPDSGPSLCADCYRKRIAEEKKANGAPAVPPPAPVPTTPSAARIR